MEYVGRDRDPKQADRCIYPHRPEQEVNVDETHRNKKRQHLRQIQYSYSYITHKDLNLYKNVRSSVLWMG